MTINIVGRWLCIGIVLCFLAMAIFSWGMDWKIPWLTYLGLGLAAVSAVMCNLDFHILCSEEEWKEFLEWRKSKDK